MIVNGIQIAILTAVDGKHPISTTPPLPTKLRIADDTTPRIADDGQYRIID